MNEKAKRTRGTGSIYRPKYKDPKTGEWKESSILWVQYYDHSGKRQRESAYTTEDTKAEKFLRKRLKEVDDGVLISPQADKTTLGELCELLLSDYRVNHLRSLNRVEDAIGHLKNFFGENSKAFTIGQGATKYVEHRQEEGAANATINRELAALKRMFTLGKRQKKVMDVPYIAMLEENNTRKGFFEYEQFTAVHKRLPKRVHRSIETAYITGWRIHDEILTRQKHHVDLKAGWLRLDPGETKNGKGRNFPLTPRLRTILEEQLEETRLLEVAEGRIIPWLFHDKGKPIKSFRRSWLTACKEAGAPGRIPHDFQRTAVRNLERAGVPRSAAKEMVGHKTDSIYERYAIADEAMLKDASSKLAILHQYDQESALKKLAKDSAKVGGSQRD